MARSIDFIVLCFGKYNFCLCSSNTSIDGISCYHILLSLFYMLNAFILRKGLLRLVSALLHNTMTKGHGLGYVGGIFWFWHITTFKPVAALCYFQLLYYVCVKSLSA